MLGTLIKVLPIALPIAIDAVRLVEKLFGGGNGDTKRSAAVEIVKIAVVAAEGITKKDLVDNDKFAEGVGKIVDGIVLVLNSTGQFKKENV